MLTYRQANEAKRLRSKRENNDDEDNVVSKRQREIIDVDGPPNKRGRASAIEEVILIDDD